MEQLIELAKTAGPFVAIVIFFIYRDYIREKRMSDRLDKVEDYQRNTLVNVVEENTSALRENKEATVELVRALDLRPCLQGKVKG